jgi:hypothetical protein
LLFVARSTTTVALGFATSPKACAAPRPCVALEAVASEAVEAKLHEAASGGVESLAHGGIRRCE